MARDCVIAIIFIVAAIFYFGSSFPYSEFSLPEELGDVEIQNISVSETELRPKIDIFVEAERLTGVSAEILRGIAAVESHFQDSAIGDNGMSHGMFQLHSRWYGSRVEKYGYFDPFDPADAAIIAGYIIQENLRAFNGDLRMAIAAYQQGAYSVKNHGVLTNYSDRVLYWRNDPEKIIAFLSFQGIIETGRVKDGRADFGTQATYKPNDTFAAQIPWRGSSGFSYQQWPSRSFIGASGE